jgi:hypothetical protein
MTRAVDDGYFPEGRSVLRRVHAERAVGLFFGQRALMIGALNPLAFTGTIDHTRGLLKPFARLAHTGKAFETIFFGTRAEPIARWPGSTASTSGSRGSSPRTRA